METLQLKAFARTKTGNGPARQLRAQGQIPAIVYGPGKTNEMVAVNDADIQALMRRGGLGRAILALEVEGGSKRNVQIKELQMNHLTNEVLHIDFYEVAADAVLTVNVPVLPVGKSIGVENGGIVQLVLRELKVNCPVNKIPQGIEVDITDLNVGDGLRVRDIVFPANVTPLDDERSTVVTIAGKKVKAVDDEEGGESAEGAEA